MAQRNQERQLTVRDVFGRHVRMTFYRRRDINAPEEADIYVETPEQEYARRHRYVPYYDRDEVRTGVIRGGHEFGWAQFVSDDGLWTYPLRFSCTLIHESHHNPGYDGRRHGDWEIEVLEEN